MSYRKGLSIHEFRRTGRPTAEERVPLKEIPKPMRRQTIIIDERITTIKPRYTFEEVASSDQVRRRPRSPSPVPVSRRFSGRTMSPTSKDRKVRREKRTESYGPLPPELATAKDDRRPRKDNTKPKLDLERALPRTRTAKFADDVYSTPYNSNYNSPLFEDRSPVDYDSSRSSESRRSRLPGESSRIKSTKPIEHRSSKHGRDEQHYVDLSNEHELIESLPRRTSTKRKDDYAFQDRVPRTSYQPPQAYKDKYKAAKERTSEILKAFNIDQDTATHNLHSARAEEARRSALAVQLEELRGKLRKVELSNQTLAETAREERIRARDAELKLKQTTRQLREAEAQRKLDNETRERLERQEKLAKTIYEEIENSPSPVRRVARPSFGNASRFSPTSNRPTLADAFTPTTTNNAAMDAIFEAIADADRQGAEVHLPGRSRGDRDDDRYLPGGLRTQTARNTRYDHRDSTSRDYRYK